MVFHPAYGQVAALFAAVLVLIAGNGLLSTLVPLSALRQGFAEITIGFIGSAYFGGMFLGCIAAPRIVARAGHIRAFAAFAAMAAASALAHPIMVDPWAWAVVRALTGFCFAGLYATIESWVQDKAENVVRGQLLAFYQIVNYLGSAIGQQSLQLGDPSSFALFSGAAAALALSVLPLAFTRAEPPTAPPVPRLRLLWLYRISPVAVVGCCCAGVANGTLWALGPVFANLVGFGAPGVAAFMTAIIVGAALVQWPVGRLADRFDRRYLIAASIVLAIAAQAALVALSHIGLTALLFLGAAVGASMLVLYPLSAGHAGDLAGRENAVEVSSALLLAYTLGAMFGPVGAAAAMAQFAPSALFVYNALIGVAFLAFVIWRLRQRPPGGAGET